MAAETSVLGKRKMMDWQAPLRTYDVERFTCNVDHLKCAICTNVMKQPVTALPDHGAPAQSTRIYAPVGCPHAFCRDCFSRQSRPECSICRRSFRPVTSDLLALQIRNLPARCVYCMRGCLFVGTLVDVDAHESGTSKLCFLLLI